MIPKDIVEEILRRVSIVHLISQNIPLKKAGHNHKGFCPFHNDKNNPSLSVSDEKGLYHCFSCGAGGNALTFMKEYHKLDFIDAVKELGTFVGINVEEYLEQNKDSLPLRNILKKMHIVAQEYFIKQLYNFKDPGTRFAVNTIKKRKLDKNTLELFGIGYGGTAWDGLYASLIEQGFKSNDIIESGLCGKTDQGKYYDRFRNRITFPISDSDGNIIAFGGRALDTKTNAKYINSPETVLFKKGHFLYAWHLAKEQAAEVGEVIVAEGYLDVIRLFQAGFSNAVAPLGTGLTEDRINFLKNKIDTMILCFDGDIAGQKSAYRSAGIAAKCGLLTKVACLPENEDPDSFLLAKGPGALGQTIQDSLSGEDFVLDSAKKFLPNTQQFLNAVFEYAVNLEGSGTSGILTIATEQFLKKVAEIIITSFSAVEMEFKKYKELYFKYDRSETFDDQNSPITNKPQEHINAEEILALLIMFPEFLDHIAQIVTPEDFPTEEMKNFYKQLLFHPERNSNEWIIIAGQTPFIKHTAKFFQAPDMRIVKNYAVGLRINSLKSQQEMISKQIIFLEQKNQQDLSLSQKILNIQTEIINLKKELYYL